MTISELGFFSALISTILAFVGGITVAFVIGGMSRQVKVAEFRQAWINALREDVAGYLGATQRWFIKYAEGQDAQWKLDKMGNEASVFLYRIKMRLNPHDNPSKKLDDEFLKSLDKIRNPAVYQRSDAEHHWGHASEEILLKARELLKREWEVTKGLPIFSWPWQRSQMLKNFPSE